MFPERRLQRRSDCPGDCAPRRVYRRSYPPRSTVRQRSASSASSEGAAVAAEGAAVSLGRPGRSSEGSTRFSRSRGTEEILVSQGSASPIVPILYSWDIDAAQVLNVRVRSPGLPQKALLPRTNRLIRQHLFR